MISLLRLYLRSLGIQVTINPKLLGACEPKYQVTENTGQSKDTPNASPTVLLNHKKFSRRQRKPITASNVYMS